MCLQENYCYILITYFNKVEKDNCIEISPKYLIRMSKKKILEKGFHQRHQLKRWRGISKEDTEMKPDDKKKESDNKRKEKNLLTMNLK